MGVGGMLVHGVQWAAQHEAIFKCETHPAGITTGTVTPAKGVGL